MISRRSLFFGLVAFFSLILLLASSRRLGSWPGDGADYTVYPPSPEPPTTGTHQQGDGSSKSGGSANGGGSSGTGDAGKTMPYHDGMPKRPYDPQCDTFPDTSGILLIMKTGASEAYDRIPTQLMTMLKCLPDFLIFSDMAQTIGGFQIRDSLETMLPEAMEGNKDFDLYRRQRACLVDQQNCNKLGDPATEGWNLDKYKNIHMAEKTYNLRPNYKWYVFVDADTYVLWPNLVQWLAKLDPNKKTYLGSVSLINNFPFSHGGSGYIVSHAALKEFAGEHPGIANKYDMRVHNECCGDYLFSVAMKDTIQLGVQQVVCLHISSVVLTVPLVSSPDIYVYIKMKSMKSVCANCITSGQPLTEKNRSRSPTGRHTGATRL